MEYHWDWRTGQALEFQEKGCTKYGQVFVKYPDKFSTETWEAETLNIFSHVKTVLQKQSPFDVSL